MKVFFWKGKVSGLPSARFPVSPNFSLQPRLPFYNLPGFEHVGAIWHGSVSLFVPGCSSFDPQVPPRFLASPPSGFYFPNPSVTIAISSTIRFFSLRFAISSARLLKDLAR